MSRNRRGNDNKLKKLSSVNCNPVGYYLFSNVILIFIDQHNGNY